MEGMILVARKKKRRISVKKISRLVVCTVIIFVILFNINNIRKLYISKTTGYNMDSVSVFLENDIYNIIKEYDYSETLEVILDTEYYNEKYIKEYVDINYLKDDLFIKNVSLLLDKGYSSNDINSIYSVLNNESINILLSNNYIEDIANLVSIEYFHEDNLKRYIKYYEEKTLDVETIVTYVNIGLDNDYYTNVIDIEDQDSITVLVNKYNKLQSDYVPSSLKTVSSKYGTGKMQTEAADAFEEMCAAAKEENITLYGGSGYRSYSYQQNLYNRYALQDGKEEADTYSARAGYSEHQTGLAMDVMNGRWEYIDEDDKEYTWLINNSYKYGFILRYLKGKEEITGYVYEPWHYRYVGVELATEITNLGITYDEYVAKNS